MVNQMLEDQVGSKSLEKGNEQLRGIHPTALHRDQNYGNNDAGCNLQTHLGSTGEPEIPAVDNLDVVICKTNCGKRSSCKDRDPNERVGEIGPEQCRHYDCDRNQ